MNTTEFEYLCVGVCMDDPDSGYCLGCGRPPPPTSNDEQAGVARDHSDHSPTFAQASAPACEQFPNTPERSIDAQPATAGSTVSTSLTQ